MRRLLSALLIVIGLSTLAGCGPTESIDGPTATYRHKPGGALLLLVAGLGVTAAGGYFVYQDHQIAQARKQRRKKGRARPEDTSYTNTGRKWGLLITGVLMLFVFLPGMLAAHVTVTPEEVVVDDSLFWFLPNSTTVRFDELRNIDSRSEEKWSRRGKRTEEYVVFLKTDGTTEEVKANALVKAAMDRVMAGLDARKNQVPADGVPPADNQPVAAADSTAGNDLSSAFNGLFNPGAGDEPAASTPSVPSGVATTTVPPAGTGRDGGTRTPATTSAPQDVAAADPGFSIPADASVPSGVMVLARIDGRWVHATAVKTQPEGAIQVVPFGDQGQAHSLPRAEVRSVVPEVIRSPRSPHTATAAIAAAAPVTAETKLQKGMRLKGLDGATWRDAEVLEVLPSGQVKVHWVGWDATWDEALPREKLRLVPGTQAAASSEELSSQPSTAAPRPFQPRQPGATPGGSPSDPPGRPIGTQPLRRGVRVMAQMDDQWRPGTVVEDAADGQARVLVLGVPGGPQSIPLDRLRLR